MRLLFTALLIPFHSFVFCQTQGATMDVDQAVHTFYYNWYGNPEHDGAYYHWKHAILPHWSDTTWNNAGTFPGGEDIGANYYPSLGCYSSNDSVVIARHMRWIREAGIGVVVMTWWGKGSYEDRSMRRYLEAAQVEGLKIAVHVEPFYKSIEELRTQLVYIAEQYGSSPAMYKIDGKPVYYVYDSYRFSAADWSHLLTPSKELSIRGTVWDAVFIGLWVKENEEKFFMTSGFDGFYTYFASIGFEYGCTPENWPRMAEFARSAGLLFIPCAGPGYIDTRIRPWNAQNIQDREKGAYFEKMYSAAAHVSPDFIGITSFNEWHEGTQIEPAIPKKFENFQYEDYQPKATEFYLRLTRYLIETYPRH